MIAMLMITEVDKFPGLNQVQWSWLSGAIISMYKHKKKKIDFI